MGRNTRNKAMNKDEVAQFLSAATALHKTCITPYIKISSDQYGALHRLSLEICAAIEVVTGARPPWAALEVSKAPRVKADRADDALAELHKAIMQDADDRTLSRLVLAATDGLPEGEATEFAARFASALQTFSGINTADPDLRRGTLEIGVEQIREAWDSQRRRIKYAR